MSAVSRYVLFTERLLSGFIKARDLYRDFEGEILAMTRYSNITSCLWKVKKPYKS